MEHFFNTDPQADEGKPIVQHCPALEEPTDTAPKAADPGIGYVFEHTRGRGVPHLLQLPGRSARPSAKACASTAR